MTTRVITRNVIDNVRVNNVFLAHLSLLRVSFWDTAMSVVGRTCGPTRRPRSPSVNFLACVHSTENSFDPKFMKLCQNVNHHNI